MSRGAKKQRRCPQCHTVVQGKARICRSCGEYLRRPAAAVKAVQAKGDSTPKEPVRLSTEESHPVHPAAPKFPLRSIFPVMDYHGNPLPVPALLMIAPGA